MHGAVRVLQGGERARIGPAEVRGRVGRSIVEAHREGEEPVLDWLRRFLRRGPAVAPAAAALAAPKPPGAAAAPVATGSDPVEEHPFAPFARALGVDLPSEPSTDPGDDAGDQELAERILAHFRANKPPPASSPAFSLQILNIMAKPDAEVSELARLIARDPALSAGILSVANSAYYRGASEIETVRDAITRLGLGEVGRVAGAVSARTLFNPRVRTEQTLFGPRWSALYHRAITVASGAAWLALRNRRVRADRAFVGGLLHDVGASLALRSVAALLLDRTLSVPDGARIDRVLDRVHAEVGGEAHRVWGLPQYLTTMAVRHHEPEIPASEELADLHAVRLASALEDLHGPFAARGAREIVQSAAALELDAFAVRALAAELREAEARTAVLLGPSPADPRRGGGQGGEVDGRRGRPPHG